MKTSNGWYSLPRKSREPTRFDRALVAFESELDNPRHTSLSLIGAVGATMEPPLTLDEDAVEGIEFLMTAGASRAVVVYAIVREFDAFR